MTKKQQKEFEKLCRPVVDFLATLHPHMSIIIDNSHAELLEGVDAFTVDPK